VSSFVHKLYRGETTIGFVRHRKWWYIGSGVALLICVLSIALQGFNLGVDFKGGNSFQFPSGKATVAQVKTAADDSGVRTESVQQVGKGSSSNFVIKTGILSTTDVTKLKSTLATRVGSEISIKSHPMTAKDISQDQVSASWGKDVTRKALVALIVFIIAVTIFISFFFEWRLSVGAISGLLHDLLLTAGVYSLVHWEVTPDTVVGLLTILGYSLYDNIVVYDKVRENTRGLLAAGKQTYSEAANRAVNQTLARSINTSLIALLPVAGLLFVGAGLLGVGDLKDLALVLFVGLATGAYSSLFLATPIACTLKERQPEYAALTKRLANRRTARARTAPAAGGSAAGQLEGSGVAVAVLENDEVVDEEPIPSNPPRPGARPQRPPRPRGRSKGGPGGRPQAKRKR
jgi:preprotein translocase subunit SecF